MIRAIQLNNKNTNTNLKNNYPGTAIFLPSVDLLETKWKWVTNAYANGLINTQFHSFECEKKAFT